MCDICDNVQVVYKELTRNWVKSKVAKKWIIFVEKVKRREYCELVPSEFFLNGVGRCE